MNNLATTIKAVLGVPISLIKRVKYGKWNGQDRYYLITQYGYIEADDEENGPYIFGPNRGENQEMFFLDHVVSVEGSSIYINNPLDEIE